MKNAACVIAPYGRARQTAYVHSGFNDKYISEANEIDTHAERRREGTVQGRMDTPQGRTDYGVTNSCPLWLGEGGEQKALDRAVPLCWPAPYYISLTQDDSHSFYAFPNPLFFLDTPLAFFLTYPPGVYQPQYNPAIITSCVRKRRFVSDVFNFRLGSINNTKLSRLIARTVTYK